MFALLAGENGYFKNCKLVTSKIEFAIIAIVSCTFSHKRSCLLLDNYYWEMPFLH